MMRASSYRLRASMWAIGQATLVLLATPKRQQTPAARRPLSLDAGGSIRSGASLADFHSGISSSWIAAASNKMLQPQHVEPNSRKLVWWACPSCAHQFHQRIDLHVAAGGACPECKAKPPLVSNAKTKSSRHTTPLSVASLVASLKVAEAAQSVVHRCRPDSSLDTLAAPNVNRIKRSVSDGGYLRTNEQRILLPMLAKSYEKEQEKISSDEVVYVSPKLDGIRCVAAYDRHKKQILFFSRSGTLFECCDAFIEPYLRRVFELDPTLVLDGELYNNSTNTQRLRSAASASTRSIAQWMEIAGMELAASGRKRRASPRRSEKSRSTSHGGAMHFEQLVSAIRTTRERRTADVEVLQSKLQYHVFDVLYSASFSKHHTPSFGERFVFLSQLMADLHRHNASAFGVSYQPLVISLVPSLLCIKSQIDAVLQAHLQLGYEGVMVRRDSLQGRHVTLTDDQKEGGGDAADDNGESLVVKKHASGSTATLALNEALVRRALKRVREVTAARATEPSTDTSGAYAYGQRSGALLKYKVMKDEEFVIVSAVEGKGKWKGCLGAFVCETKDRTSTFTVTPATTDERKRSMWKHWKQQYKGKALTVQYQQLTPDGVPRFPVGKCVRGSSSGADWV